MPPSGNQITRIPLDQLQPGPADERRADLDHTELQELAHSIARDGLLCPIIVTPTDEGYATVAGRRRREACKLAGLAEADCIILDHPDANAFNLSVAENLFRSQLTPYEEAAACAQAIQDHGMTITEVANAMQRSPTWVTQRLDILDWPTSLLDAVHARAISVSAAEPLARIRNEATREAMIEQAVAHGATARITSAWAQAANATHTCTTPDATSPGSDAPPTPPTIPHQRCWACKALHPVTALNHLPTCAVCYEEIPPAIQALTAPTHDSSAPTA